MGLKWVGKFIIDNGIFPNEILADGLDFLGGVLSGSIPDAFASIRIANAAEDQDVTAVADVNFSTDTNTLEITSIATFTSVEVTFDPAFAYLVSSEGVDIARAPIVAIAGQAIEVTRVDTFMVNQ